MRIINSILKTMTPIQRAIVALHLVDRMGHEKIAQTLNLDRAEYNSEWKKARLTIAEYFAATHGRS